MCRELCGNNQVISLLIAGYTDITGNPLKIDEFIIEANMKN
jgi:hypothetical protein